MIVLTSVIQHDLAQQLEADGRVHPEHELHHRVADQRDRRAARPDQQRGERGLRFAEFAQAPGAEADQR